MILKPLSSTCLGYTALGFDSVGMIFRFFLVSEIFKRKYSCHVLWGGGGGGGAMTVEVRTCFAGSLLILSVACLLVLGL